MIGQTEPDTNGGDITQQDYQSLAAFRFALRRFMHFSVQAAQEAGLTAREHQALLSIKGYPAEGAITVGQLAEHLVVAPHTAAELVSRLDEDGMLKKVPDANDRRKACLLITAKAERALSRLSKIHLEEIRVMAPGLIETLQDLLPGKAKPRLKRSA